MIRDLLARLQPKLAFLGNRLREWARPQRRPIVVGLLLDHLRSPAALRWENALLRKQLRGSLPSDSVGVKVARRITGWP